MNQRAIMPQTVIIHPMCHQSLITLRLVTQRHDDNGLDALEIWKRFFSLLL